MVPESPCRRKKYQDYYIFRDEPEDQIPTNWQSKFGGPAWEYVPSLKKWYLHLYDVTQADLNWENPEVRGELKKVIRFWKNKGIKGFRFDVINVISKPELFEDDLEGDGRRFYTDGPHVHEYLKELTRDTGIEDMITVGEMSSTSLENCIRYSGRKEKELSMCFNFHHLKVDYKDGDKWTLMEPDRIALKKLFETWQMGMQDGDGWNALFWCNHDQPRVVSRMGNEDLYWKESAKMLAAAIHMMRGTPYVYQGEELGMTNAYFTELKDYRDIESIQYFHEYTEAGIYTPEYMMKCLMLRGRDNARTPMQWEDSHQAGFTEGTPWIRVNSNYKEINAKQQLSDPNSIFRYYQKLIRLRKEKPVIVYGVFEALYRDHDQIFAYTRTLEGEKLLTVCNFSEHVVEMEIPEEFQKNAECLITNLGRKDFGKKVVLKPYEAFVLYKNL